MHSMLFPYTPSFPEKHQQLYWDLKPVICARINYQLTALAYLKDSTSLTDHRLSGLGSHAGMQFLVVICQFLGLLMAILDFV